MDYPISFDTYAAIAQAIRLSTLVHIVGAPEGMDPSRYVDKGQLVNAIAAIINRVDTYRDSIHFRNLCYEEK